MAVQVSKHGLGFFPLSSNMIYDRVVKRIMKKEGDGAMTVLINVLSNIFADKGYFVKVDEWFYEDIASNLYSFEAEDVKRIIAQAVEYDLFNKKMFDKYQILTSWDVQWQYVYSLRRRVLSHLNSEYWLVSQQDMPNGEASKRKAKQQKRVKEGEEDADNEALCVTETAECVTETAECVTEVDECVTSCAPAKQNNTIPDETEQQKINETVSPLTPPGEVKMEGGRFHLKLDDDTLSAPMLNARTERSRVPIAVGQTKPKVVRKVWTLQSLEELTLPNDGVKRSFDGLIRSLRSFQIEPDDQYAIICLSNYGAIGHPVWKVLSDMHGTTYIKSPGKFILSKLTRSGRKA